MVKMDPKIQNNSPLIDNNNFLKILGKTCQSYKPNKSLKLPFNDIVDKSLCPQNEFRINCRLLLKDALKDLYPNDNFIATIENNVYTEFLDLNFQISNRKKSTFIDKSQANQFIMDQTVEYMKKYYIEMCVYNTLVTLLKELGTDFAQCLINQNCESFSQLKNELFLMAILLFISKMDSSLLVKELEVVLNKKQLWQVFMECVNYIPCIHPVIYFLIDYLISASKLEKVWKTLSKEKFFSPNSSDELHYLGFKCETYLIPKLDLNNTHIIINSNFLKFWIECLSSKQHPLNKVAKELADKMVSSFNDFSDDQQLLLLETLVEPPGSIMFDTITREKLLRNLLTICRENTALSWCHKLKNLLLTTNKVNKREDIRVSLVFQMSEMFRNNVIKENKDVCLSLLNLLMVNSYFTINDDHEFKLSPEPHPILTKQFKIAFSHSLMHISSLNDLMIELFNILKLSLDEGKITYEDVDELKKLLQLMDESLLQMKPTENNDKIKSSIFKNFLSCLAISGLYNPKKIIPTFEEVLECYKQSFSTPEPDKPFWSEVFCDLILSLLLYSIPSPFVVLITSQCCKVWKYLCDIKISKEIIEQCESALIMNTIDDDERDSEESEDNNDEDESGEDEMEDEEDEEMNDVGEEFKSKIREALGPVAIMGDEENDIEMGQDEINRVDEALSLIFKDRFSKKEDKASEEMITKFKLKVCELIEYLILSKNITTTLLLDIVKMLLKVIDRFGRSSVYSNLVYKIINLLTILVKKSKNNLEQIKEKQVILNTFETILKIGYNIGRIPVQKALGRTASWIVKLNVKDDLCDELLLNSLKHHIVKTNCYLTKEFFFQFLKDHHHIASKFIDVLIPFISNNDVRAFKRLSAIYLVNTALNLLDGEITYIEKINDNLLKGLEWSITHNKASLIHHYITLLYSIHKIKPDSISQQLKTCVNSIQPKIRKKLNKNTRKLLNIFSKIFETNKEMDISENDS